MGRAPVKCHIKKDSGSSCTKINEHVEIEHKRTASVLKRVGMYHDVSFGVDEV